MELGTEPDLMKHAEYLLSARRYQNALAVAHQLMTLRPGDPRPLILASRAELGLGSLDAAESAARKAVAVSPLSPDAHRALVAALTDETYDTGRLGRRRAAGKALSAARRLVELAPNSASSYWSLADAYAAAHRPKPAVKASDMALDLAPKTAHTWLIRARAAECAYDFEVAEAAICEALRIDPDNYVADHELGIILRRRSQTAYALRQPSTRTSVDQIARQTQSKFQGSRVATCQFLILAVTSPLLLVLPTPRAWLLGSILLNMTLWRINTSARWLEHCALTVATWRTRIALRVHPKKETSLPPSTAIQTYRNRRTILVLLQTLLLLLAWIATGSAAEQGLQYTPLGLFVDVPTCAFAWWMLKRFRARPTSTT